MYLLSPILGKLHIVVCFVEQAGDNNARAYPALTQAHAPGIGMFSSLCELESNPESTESGWAPSLTQAHPSTIGMIRSLYDPASCPVEVVSCLCDIDRDRNTRTETQRHRGRETQRHGHA